ncbi:hypothetical protein ACFLSS_00200 [Bacteroidota bacterium]
MFGFAKFSRKSSLGGEIFLEQRRRRRIVTIVFAVIALAIVNAILYSLTNF